MERVVTFDFHNTIARCEPWFELEVRTLPGRVYQWLQNQDGVPAVADMPNPADRAYRMLREEIVASGVERDAVSCVEAVFATLAISADRASIARGVDALMREALASLEDVPGAIATIRELWARGCRLGVVSSAVHHPFLCWSLAALGIDDAFDVVTTSASSGFYKSRPEIYTATLAAMGGTPHGSVHVGDSLRWDVGGAQRAGMKGAWLRGTAVDAFTAPGAAPRPDLVLDSLVGATPALLELLHAD